MNERTLIKRISVDPEIMLGKPVIKGTRLPVDIIIEKIAYGDTIKDILDAYPFIAEDDIRAALLYAAKVLKTDEVYII